MLKQLFRKLYLVFVVTIMAIVTGVIGFSFSNHVKASEAAQVTLLPVSYTHLNQEFWIT